MDYMINGNLEQFLDTGWFSEATIYYNGYIYWCEGYTNDSKKYHFFVNRWKAKNDNNTVYNTYIDSKGEPKDFSEVLKLDGKDMNEIKKEFLTRKIFDDKSFWEAEKDIVWLEEGENIQCEE